MKSYYAEQREAGKKVMASVKSKIHKRTAPQGHARNGTVSGVQTRSA
jgi:hypothetical protein